MARHYCISHPPSAFENSRVGLSSCTSALVLGQKAGKSTDWTTALIASLVDHFKSLNAVVMARGETEAARTYYLHTSRDLDAAVRIASCSGHSDLQGIHDLCHLRLAHIYFGRGVVTSEAGMDDRAMSLFEHVREPLESCAPDAACETEIGEMVKDMRDSLKRHMACSESRIRRLVCDRLLQVAVFESEEVSAEDIWPIIDGYKEAILLTREVDVEEEAIGLSRLGSLFDKVLKMEGLARTYYLLCIQLVNTTGAQKHSHEAWYQDATGGLLRLQRAADMRTGAETRNEALLATLRPQLEAIGAAAERGSVALINHLYAEHPPKNVEHKKLEEAHKDPKRAVLRALQHYHPDKQVAYEEEWRVLAEEITKVLNEKYMMLKQVS